MRRVSWSAALEPEEVIKLGLLACLLIRFLSYDSTFSMPVRRVGAVCSLSKIADFPHHRLLDIVVGGEYPTRAGPMQAASAAFLTLSLSVLNHRITRWQGHQVAIFPKSL